MLVPEVVVCEVVLVSDTVVPVPVVVDSVVWEDAEVVVVSVVVLVEVKFVVQKLHVVSHMCLEGHVGQKATSQAGAMIAHVLRQSSYFSQVVAVVVSVSLPVCVVSVAVLLVVLDSDVTVEEPVDVVSVLLDVSEDVVPEDVAEVVDPVVVDVSLVEVSDVLVAELVKVLVVQKPHLASHMPAKTLSTASGEKSVSHGSWQGPGPIPVHVTLQK